MTQIEKQLSIAEDTESSDSAVTSYNGLMTNERLEKHKPTNIVLPARGILEVQKSVPFQLLVASFTKRPVRLSKDILIVVGNEPPEKIISYHEKASF